MAATLQTLIAGSCWSRTQTHAGNLRLRKSRRDLTDGRQGSLSVCLYQPGKQAGRAVEPTPVAPASPSFPPPPLIPSSFHSPSLTSRSRRELRHRREHPIGVSLSNEGGHHAPLLAPTESILGTYSPPHSSTPRGTEIPRLSLIPAHPQPPTFPLFDTPYERAMRLAPLSHGTPLHMHFTAGAFTFRACRIFLNKCFFNKHGRMYRRNCSAILHVLLRLGEKIGFPRSLGCRPFFSFRYLLLSNRCHHFLPTVGK